MIYFVITWRGSIYLVTVIILFSFLKRVLFGYSIKYELKGLKWPNYDTQKNKKVLQIVLRWSAIKNVKKNADEKYLLLNGAELYCTSLNLTNLSYVIVHFEHVFIWIANFPEEIRLATRENQCLHCHINSANPMFDPHISRIPRVYLSCLFII